MGYLELSSSSFLDYTGYGITDKATVIDAFQLNDSQHEAIEGQLPFYPRVAIVLERQNSPEELLSQPWGKRQQKLKELRETNTLWPTYGANPDDYDQAVSILRDELGLKILEADDGGYETSAESRTIWIELKTADDFSSLFNTQLRAFTTNTSNKKIPYWDGNLSIDERIKTVGIYVNTVLPNPYPDNFSEGTSFEPPQGPQSIGNIGNVQTFFPGQFASDYYRFPLANKAAIPTGSIGLIAPVIGSAVDNKAHTLQELLNAYIKLQGIDSSSAEISTQGEGVFSAEFYSERDLDISVAASINPNSDIRLYTGYPAADAGSAADRMGNMFTCFHSAGWDKSANRPAIISTSFVSPISPSPDSPFMRAWRELYIDLALQGVTLFLAAGDFGSSAYIGTNMPLILGNGLPNIQTTSASSYGLNVGGTSLSTKSQAESDSTLNNNDQAVAQDLVGAAKKGEREAIWRLIQGGLIRSWRELKSKDYFIETVWNDYLLYDDFLGSYKDFLGMGRLAGGGGVDPTQAIPDYQQKYGLKPQTSDPQRLSGRGIPDVSAASGGNSGYQSFDSREGPQNKNFLNSVHGTSAATPLWASLAIQLNAVFSDQGLPNLGYMNDLLYTASAVNPACFNDITLGNNRSSFSFGGSYISSNGDGAYIPITPTGYGYEAGNDYDLVTGLGSPNGMLLARTLTTIAHIEMFHQQLPRLLATGNGETWLSGATQNLLFQPIASSQGEWEIVLGEAKTTASSSVADTYGWTRRLAQQSLQADFSPELARMFDGQSLGQVYQSNVRAGELIDVRRNGQSTHQSKAMLTNAYGFADLITSRDTMEVARPVAIATTAMNADNQEAIVRMRQVGANNLTVRFYRVDNLTGMIDDVNPGDAGYETALTNRLYATSTGATYVSGGGYGAYTEARLTGVDSGDLIAMSLSTSENNTFYAFSGGNERVNGEHISHLRNFGLNTWGWEDLYGGGDLDFNDLVVQLDFTSAAGSEILA